uniref:Uncharacterized protein TCIL3000_10_2240 n=1 Tax=Trypanosoma congolense (strain IL3000) TaxID=1068625 RepID=G0UVP9_TRYCI|nr:unnamed protein product [Trypanosoma congolense IL3000]
MTTHSEAIFPNILWAQRPEFVLLTIPLQDATSVVVEVREGGILHFEAEASGESYRCDVELFREVVSEESRHVTQPRQVDIQLKKKSPSSSCGGDELSLCRSWPRLTREKSKNNRIQVDWSRWQDEDEEDDGGLGMDYNDLMSQMMNQRGLEDSQESDFGDGDGARTDGFRAGKDNVINADGSDSDDYDDLPPLEP